MFNPRRTTLALCLMAGGTALAQTPAVNGETSRLLTQLSEQVRELRIEVASLRVAWHEQRMQSLADKLHQAEQESRLAEYEESSAQEEMLAADVQLGGSELDSAERSALSETKDALLGEGQRRMRQRTAEALQRVSALKSDWEREQAAAEASRRTLAMLREDTPKGTPATAK